MPYSILKAFLEDSRRRIRQFFSTQNILMGGFFLSFIPCRPLCLQTGCRQIQLNLCLSHIGSILSKVYWVGLEWLPKPVSCGNDSSHVLVSYPVCLPFGNCFWESVGTSILFSSPIPISRYFELLSAVHQTSRSKNRQDALVTPCLLL